jgi:DNA replication protein DnaC
MLSVGQERWAPTPTCQTCNDIGFVYARHAGLIDRSRVEPCACQAERIEAETRQRLLKHCELPFGSDDKTLETFDTGGYETLKSALRAATALAEGSPSIKWLTLSGGRDLGKTHLAIAVCRGWLGRGVPAKYVFVPDLLDWLRDAFDQPGVSLSSRMEVLRDVPLLVLDDLGVQKPTEWAMERLMTVINYRCENHLPLMVTTNKSIENLPGDENGRIGSRLKRFVPGKVIVMEGPEYVTRRKKRKGDAP